MAAGSSVASEKDMEGSGKLAGEGDCDSERVDDDDVVDWVLYAVEDMTLSESCR